MKIISLKDYAKQNNISYEAVRKQVARYKKDLEGHIIKDNRTQFLDEEAVAFLDAKREKSPVVIVQQDKDEKIKRLEEESKALLQTIAMLQDKQLQLQEELTEHKLLAAKTSEAEARAMVAEQKATEAEKRALDAETALTVAEEENKTLADIAEINAQEAEAAKVEAAEALKRAEVAEAEAERLKNRGFWARLFNKE